jgi:intracellular septation protein A
VQPLPNVPAMHRAGSESDTLNPPADGAAEAERHTIHLPAVGQILRVAASHLIEATIAPLALFYVLLAAAGLRWALVGALVWSYSAVARRLVSHQRVPGILLLGTALFTVRTFLALATGSTFVYFLQPTLGTFLVAALFLLSVRTGRPLAERLAHDFCPLPPDLLGNTRVQRFFLRISLLWALVYVVNGFATLTLLLTSSLGMFLVLRTAASTALTVAAIACSYLWFRRSLRHEGVVLRWAAIRP